MPEHNADILSLREQNLGYKAIASRLGLTRDQVRAYCQQHGVAGQRGESTPRKDRRCAHCGALVANKRKYCSADCRVAASQARSAERIRRAEEARPPVTTCPECGREFRPRNYTEHHCSKACGRKRKHREKYPWRYESRQCKYCAQEFKPAFAEQVYCCKRCAGLGERRDTSVSDAEYRRRLAERFDGAITAMTPYAKMTASMVFRCAMCGHEWRARAGAMLDNAGCPKCVGSQSRGELAIAEWLSAQRVQFVREHRFDDCRAKLPLPFDFAVMDSGHCAGIIEFHGEQHYRPIAAWGGSAHLQRVQKHDQIKARYCARQGIPLVLIRHDELDKVDDILSAHVRVYTQVWRRVPPTQTDMRPLPLTSLPACAGEAGHP